MKLKIIGAGLAGCEAAYQAAKRGIKVELYEMKPEKFSPAHKSKDFAELVCSNSFRADGLLNAVGLLKEEMRRFDSVIMKCADMTKVPAGGALAVDRELFSKMVTEEIKNNENIMVISKEVSEIDLSVPTVIAAGPLASLKMTDAIKKLTEKEYLHFFDAAAPIVTADSIDMTKAFYGARYQKGGDDYINCPMTKEEYLNFYNELIKAECASLHDGVEEQKVFEGCMPIEVMAKRGEDTMRFGPLKPVGIINPNSDVRPYAVVQLRQDNGAKSLFNIVGFQTHLKFGEQKRVFSLIPGLENAEFVRYGVMHRNTYINSPKLLTNIFNMRKHKNIFFAGQITGVEGYVESAASGLVAGINAARMIKGEDALCFSSNTAFGALSNYVSNESVDNFQPMNVNFGIFNPIGERIKDKKEKALKFSERSLLEIEEKLKK